MTNEQINIKVAELCGWKPWAVLYPGRLERGWKKDRGFRKRHPNYAADLNACHEFEKTLTGEQWYEYDKLLPLRDPQKSHCTARQRCEAFLRVHGQWGSMSAQTSDHLPKRPLHMDVMKLKCPKCRKIKVVPRLDDDPPNCAMIVMRCLKCSSDGGFTDHSYFDEAGNEINMDGSPIER